MNAIGIMIGHLRLRVFRSSQDSASISSPEYKQSPPYGLTPFVPQPHAICPSFTPLKCVFDEYDTSLTYITDVVLFWYPSSALSQRTSLPFTVDLVEYYCTEQFMMARKLRLFDDDMALSVILASDDPSASDVTCVTSILHYGDRNVMLLSSDPHRRS